VHHRRGYLDAGGEAVEDEAAGFALKDGDQIALGSQVGVGAEEGCGQVAVESFGGAQVAGCGGAVDEQRVGPEDFFGELRLLEEFF